MGWPASRLPTRAELAAIDAQATAAERAELERILAALGTPPWVPTQGGPQQAAYDSEADIVGYGGAAGGGKTDLAIGLALTRHRNVGIFRQNGSELLAIVDRVGALLGSREGWNGSDRVWRTKRWDGEPLQIEFGSFPAPYEETKYQGRPHDLLVFDEAANMREASVRFLLGWLRTTHTAQRCRALLTFNPPTQPAGRWVVAFFAPWLDPRHPNPARPGELRWFAQVAGKEVECPGPEPVDDGGRMVTPLSRTFIPSRVTDNPHFAGTGYMAMLDALPDVLRRQMRDGDFSAGCEDDPWQVVPTAWVEAAQARWKRPDKLPPMDSVGIDVARGGRDETVMARRHGMWFDAPLAYPGAQTPDGPTVAGLALAAGRDRAVLHIDVIGVGASPYDFLRQQRQQVVGVNVSEKARGTDRSGRLTFRNLRSELWWRMREALDPANNTGICLPPSSRLLADLTTPKWAVSGATIEVQSRDEIKEATGRSPDYASAYCLALITTPKVDAVATLMQEAMAAHAAVDWDPYDA